MAFDLRQHTRHAALIESLLVGLFIVQGVNGVSQGPPATVGILQLIAAGAFVPLAIQSWSKYVALRREGRSAPHE
jgi:hypothetical protein